MRLGHMSATWGVLAIALSATTAAAQVGAPVVALSADTVPMGELVQLEVRLRVPPRSVVYFPDSLLAGSGLESFSSVDWRAEAAPDGGATLTLTYPLITFGAGTVPVPGLDLFIGPAGSETSGEALPGNSVVGDWSNVPRGPGAIPFTTRIPRQGVWVEPVFTMEDWARGVDPMPPDDVVGSNWNWPSVALILLFSAVLGGAVVTSTRELLSARPGGTDGGAPIGPMTVQEARLKALEELDRLLAAGLHTEGRTHEFYTRSSGIVRGYVERLDPQWGPDLTSSELMRRLGERLNAKRGAGLMPEMRAAEVVKFGRRRPGGSTAENHLQTLRAWIDASGEVDS